MMPLKQTPEPTAADLFVCVGLRRFPPPWLRRSAVSGGCGSAFTLGENFSAHLLFNIHDMKTTLMTILCCVAILASGCATSHSKCKAASSVESGIIGKWRYLRSAPDQSAAYEFLADHTYKYSQPSPKMSWSGRYEVESPNLLVLTGGPRGDEVMQIVFRGDTLNQISSDGVLMPLKKVSE
jgi:hypothetical protein